MIPPFFSVIIPLYNKAFHVERAINSIFSQTEKDYEVILVDDCSTDNGLDIAKKKIELCFHKYKIIQRKKRGGSVAPPRNTGIRYAHGILVAFLDADDEWNPDFLKNIHSLYDNFPESEAYCCARELCINNKIEPDSYLQKSDIKTAHEINLNRYLDARRFMGNPFRVPAMAFRPEALDDVGGFIHAPRSSDIDLMFRYFLRGKKAAWSPYVGVRIYRVPDSVMAQTKHQSTRPWFYTVAQALCRQNLDKAVRKKMISDVERRKRQDILLAMKDRKLTFLYWNNIYFWRSPLFYSAIFVALLSPKIIQPLIHRLAIFQKQFIRILCRGRK